MDSGEGTGLGVAVFGHVLLFGGLSLGFLATPNPTSFEQQPIEVSLTDDIALVSASQVPDAQVPAARLAEEEGPVEHEVPEANEAEPEPVTQPRSEEQPAPTRAPTTRPEPEPSRSPRAASTTRREQPREQPTRRDVRPTGRLDGMDLGRSDTASQSQSTTAPAATLGDREVASLRAEIRRQLRPHWSPPTGADSEKLVTFVRVRLNRDGSLAARPTVIRTEGRTASNRGQVSLHQERAIRAVELASPFRLPDRFYDAWKDFDISLDQRLAL
ncbi:cell envelope biogenesis protein TolA [Stakelama tenebrarum]|uniref:Cell envelope biogenesis protein TolA n=1 Tax=Stakelama tenebrarum TaxID=2711215 RepID=A0A6G6Y8X9_9SPHN|nr:cell envelope biogenesis protein TolA [Sphingosinithalassobacter tenebrarum]QIG81385.1 cell envelope biogenesis protein TolA [Sphingosinithalassobacter tenebrarum]